MYLLSMEAEKQTLGKFCFSKWNLMLLLNPTVEPHNTFYQKVELLTSTHYASICRFAKGDSQSQCLDPLKWEWERKGKLFQPVQIQPRFYRKSCVANVRWQRRIPVEVTNVPAESLGCSVSLLAQTEEAQNLATQTLQQIAYLQAQKMLIMETLSFFIF